LLDQPVETFPSCGHLPHIDQPRKVAERCHALLTNG
jgi:pimeloyl-ACP methyl ester carboxylesterase